MRYKFLKVLPWHGPVREFDVWNVLNEDLFGVRFIECSSYRQSTVFRNLIFPLFVLISYGKNKL